MASHIIGISGRKRSGKDTFAARLVSTHGFTRIAFADPLKAVALELDPWVKIERDEGGLLFGPGTVLLNEYHFRLAEVIESLGWEKAKEIREVRRVLQVLGVAVRDNVDQEAWVQAALNAAERISGPVVIPDVRFPNEVEAVRRYGRAESTSGTGAIVRVARPGLPETDLHISETALDALVADFPVMNDTTLEALDAQADAVARTVLSVT